MVRTYPHYNPFSVPAPKPLAWDKLFTDTKLPLDLEIGSANGRWLVDYAKAFPQRNILGVETRNKYVEAAEKRIRDSGLNNVSIIRANINTALTVLFAKDQLHKVFLMFPDPWYKKKHLKRRVITQEFLEQLYITISDHGELHIATDKESFALEIQEVLLNSQFKNKYSGFAEENIPLIISEIESYHLKLSNPIYRLVFQK